MTSPNPVLDGVKEKMTFRLALYLLSQRLDVTIIVLTGETVGGNELTAE